MKNQKKLSASDCYLSFAGCGFLGLYHAGVSACIQSYAPELYKNKKIAGASAGALAAACLVCEVDLNQCVEYMLRVVSKTQHYYLGPFDPRFKITEHLREGLEIMLPDNAHIICSNRLYISMTSSNRNRNVIVSSFRDKAELIRALLCSAYIPLFSGYIPLTFHGEWMIDGALSNNIPNLGPNTITISPFSGEADICPRDDWGYGQLQIANTNLLMNFNNFSRMLNIVWPKSLAELQKLTEDGYNDALRFLARKGFITCSSHTSQVVFLTVSVCSRTCIEDHCPECKRRLREALNSTLPESVATVFSSYNAGGLGSWIRGTKLFRLLRLITSPTVLSMSILYSIIKSLLQALVYVPGPLQTPLLPLQKMVNRLNEIIAHSIAHSNGIAHQGQLLCDALKQEYPQIKVTQFADEPFEELESVHTVSVKGHNVTISRNLLSPPAQVPSSPPPSISKANNASTPRDEQLTEPQLSEMENSFREQLKDLESWGDQFHIESIRPVDLKHYMSREQISPCAEEEDTRPLSSCASPDDYIDSGNNSEENPCFDEKPPNYSLADAKSTWSYQEYEGSNVTKVFMVLPVRSNSFTHRNRPAKYASSASRDDSAFPMQSPGKILTVQQEQHC